MSHHHAHHAGPGSRLYLRPIHIIWGRNYIVSSMEKIKCEVLLSFIARFCHGEKVRSVHEKFNVLWEDNENNQRV